jgi:hypothetical protein
VLSEIGALQELRDALEAKHSGAAPENALWTDEYQYYRTPGYIDSSAGFGEVRTVGLNILKPVMFLFTRMR